MNVREYFNQLYKSKELTITQIRKQMDDVSDFEKLPCPKGIKMAPLVKWCSDNLGHDEFVVCQNVMYFNDSVGAVKFKLMCNLKDLEPNLHKKRWY